MKKIEDFIEKLSGAEVSDETHHVMNDLIQVSETVKQVVGTQSPNIELREKVKFIFHVSEQSLRELYKATSSHMFEPCVSNPHFWISVEDENLAITFRTEAVEVFYKDGNQFHQLK